MTIPSSSWEKHPGEKKTTQDDLFTAEQGEFLLQYSEMLVSLDQTVSFLTSAAADPQTIELLSSERYLLVKTILLKRSKGLILASLSLSAMLHQCSLVDILSTLIEELSCQGSDQQPDDLS